jgi:hypothetical protein
MFEYLPSQYAWNVAVLMALQFGGEVTGTDGACRPLRRHAEDGRPKRPRRRPNGSGDLFPFAIGVVADWGVPDVFAGQR